ncbi:ATP-dependent DNA ligase [Ensifer sp. IC4062]|nr:ATP-dependent DNA ligase [Ensifer sp. IC4062]MCA1440898.1 ATP-dependent DNA ligase [Ensifer sp. IC4062]
MALRTRERPTKRAKAPGLSRKVRATGEVLTAGGFVLPVSTAAMEARSAPELPDDGTWQYEPKWDGFRCLAFKSGEEVDLRAKSGKPLGRFFPEVVTVLRQLGALQFVVDGELVIEVDGRLSFDALQMRLHPAASRVRKLSEETPAKLILFDVLVGTDGAILTGEPLAVRRAALEAFGRENAITDKLELSPFTLDKHEAERWLTGWQADATDGVVAKRRDGPYECGERAMVKVKRLKTADCVVGGFRYESDSAQIGSLLLGLYDADGTLNHVGFTATISDKERPALTRRLEALREPPGFTGKAPGGPSRWSSERSGEWEPVRPELVVEVRFDHVSNRRFRHGTKLMRWRPDKDPRQCTYEQILPR